MRDRSPRRSCSQEPSLRTVAVATLVTAATALASAGCAEPADDDDAAPSSAAALPALGQSVSAVQTQALLDDLVAALDVSFELRPVPISLVSPDPTAAFAASSYGAIQPKRGSSLVVLSTGRSGDLTGFAEPGTDFGPAGPEGDVVTLKFQVAVPPAMTNLSFRYQLLSAESPEFIGTTSNDTFTAYVTDAAGRRPIATTSVNDAAFHPVSTQNVGNGPFLLYTDDPAGVDTFTVGQIGAEADAGVTGWRLAHGPLLSAGVVMIELEIRDLGTGILDSAVVLDAFSFSAAELVDPNSRLLDADSGQVITDPVQLVAFGSGIEAVVADGVTQAVVRVRVPGPVQVRLSLMGEIGSDGAVSAVSSSPAWAGTVPTNAMLVNGSYYAFFLYRSPAAFNRGGDELLRRREAPLVVSYTHAGQPYAEQLAIGVLRPPVVIVPEMWTSCFAWVANSGALMFVSPPPGDPRGALTTSCLDYEARRGLSALENRVALRDAIDQALLRLRAEGVAATQVDVVAHGMGGLLARVLLTSSGFVAFHNFNAGSIHRLITMNTPHLGARLADEIVRTRDFSKQRGVWSQVKSILEQAAIFIDDADGDVVVDDLRSNSAVINNIRGGTIGLEPVVAYHALVSSGGRAITRPQSLGLLPSNVRTLYTLLENNHPITWNAAAVRRQRLILGPLSDIFCADGVASSEDDHDLFATVWEQKGGLEAPFVTLFQVMPSSSFTGHFRVNANQPHTDRLVALLNEPSWSPLFASSMPWPMHVPRRNSCPIALP